MSDDFVIVDRHNVNQIVILSRKLEKLSKTVKTRRGSAYGGKAWDLHKEKHSDKEEERKVIPIYIHALMKDDCRFLKKMGIMSSLRMAYYGCRSKRLMKKVARLGVKCPGMLIVTCKKCKYFQERG